MESYHFNQSRPVPYGVHHVLMARAILCLFPPSSCFGSAKSSKMPGAMITLNPYIGAAKFVLSSRDMEKVIKQTAAKIAADIAGRIRYRGTRSPQFLKWLTSTMIEFDPWFEIVPGTKKAAEGKGPKEKIFRHDAPEPQVP